MRIMKYIWNHLSTHTLPTNGKYFNISETVMERFVFTLSPLIAHYNFNKLLDPLNFNNLSVPSCTYSQNLSCGSASCVWTELHNSASGLVVVFCNGICNFQSLAFIFGGPAPMPFKPCLWKSTLIGCLEPSGQSWKHKCR